MYKKLYPSRYKRDKNSNDKMLEWKMFKARLEAKDELRSILGLRDYHVPIALHEQSSKTIL